MTIQLRELRATYHPIPGTEQTPRDRLTTPRDVAALLLPRLQLEPNEVFVIVLLDTKHRLIAISEISRGGLDATLANPRDVFKIALLGNAAAVITCHNHPSGDPTPSPDDRALWGRLTAAGEVIGVSVLDHMVLGEGRYWSLREAGGC